MGGSDEFRRDSRTIRFDARPSDRINAPGTQTFFLPIMANENDGEKDKARRPARFPVWPISLSGPKG